MSSDGTRPRPAVLGSAVFLVMNMFIGIGAFTLLVTLLAVGVGTAVVWVGLPLLALAVVLCRGGARVERARVHAMLDTYIASPYAPLPERGRWKARVKDGATWRDLAYFLLLLPVGVVEFGLMVSFWAVGLGYTFLPVYYRWLPEGEYRMWDWDRPQFVVDSFVSALPFAAVGLVVLAVAVGLTRVLAKGHAWFARLLLGPVDQWDRVGV